MILQKELGVVNNDAYVIMASKDFVIINNNYKGILVYDLELNFRAEMYLGEDFVITNGYSCSENNNVVFNDYDNHQMYIKNLEDISDRCIVRDESRLFSEFYVGENDYFYLNDYKSTYIFSINTGEQIRCYSDPKKDILYSIQKEELYLNNNKILLNKKNRILKLPIEYHENCIYKVYKGYVIEQSDYLLHIYYKNKIIERYFCPDDYMIRGVCTVNNKLFILLNYKMDIKKSIIQSYCLNMDER